MIIGQRVLVFARWSPFAGRSGEIKALRPELLVLLDGETCAMPISRDELVEESSREHITAGD